MSVCVKIGEKVQNIVLNTQQSFDLVLEGNNISCDKFIEKIITAAEKSLICHSRRRPGFES